MTIGPDIEILGSPGASYSSGDTIHRGVMGAVAGDSAEPFEVYVYNDFVNEGVLEARTDAVLEINGFTNNENFSEAGVIRSHPEGVVRYERGNLTSLNGLGTLDNQGEIQFQRTAFNSGGGILQFPIGDWVLLDGARIEDAMVVVETGGRLLVDDYNPYSNYKRAAGRASRRHARSRFTCPLRRRLILWRYDSQRGVDSSQRQ